MSHIPTLIDENMLMEFRRQALSPAVLIGKIPKDRGALLLNLPPGVGKSRAASDLANYALSSGTHDLVIYVSPTRAILDELCLRLNPELNIKVLNPRPHSLCGPLNEEWAHLESRGCSALAKSQLCGNCLHNSEKPKTACTWPGQMDDLAPELDLVGLTEQYLVLNPSLLAELIRKAEADRPLIIFDEAQFMTKPITRTILKDELLSFRNALAAASESSDDWIEMIDFLLDLDVDLRDLNRVHPMSLCDDVVAIQESGVSRGKSFRYIANDLFALNSKSTTAQWRDGDTIEIVSRIDTNNADTIILAPYLIPEIVEERLQCEAVEVYPGTRFKHSKTQFINIADTNGSARTFGSKDHFNRICDFFFALTLKNIHEGKRTVLVSRKKFMARIKKRFDQLALLLEVELECILVRPKEKYEFDHPSKVALINYGILGINDFERFDTLYCIGGYYCDVEHLNEVYQQCSPPAERMDIGITTSNGHRALVAEDGEYGTRYHSRLARPVFKMLEQGVVMQAIGRVRPFTMPAEVITFQCDDMSDELVGLRTYNSLPEARKAMSVPTLKELSKASLGERVRAEIHSGQSQNSAAKSLGVAPSTASLARKSPPLLELLNTITTHGGNHECHI